MVKPPIWPRSLQSKLPNREHRPLLRLSDVKYERALDSFRDPLTAILKYVDGNEPLYVSVAEHRQFCHRGNVLNPGQ